MLELFKFSIAAYQQEGCTSGNSSQKLILLTLNFPLLISFISGLLTRSNFISDKLSLGRSSRVSYTAYN